MKYSWSILEVYLKHSWSILEVYIKHTWRIIEAYLKHTRSKLEAYLKHTWIILEVYLKHNYSTPSLVCQVSGCPDLQAGVQYKDCSGYCPGKILPYRARLVQICTNSSFFLRIQIEDKRTLQIFGFIKSNQNSNFTIGRCNHFWLSNCVSNHMAKLNLNGTLTI